MSATGTVPLRPVGRPGRPVPTLLAVWAHPDDEAYLSAGLAASAVDEGWRVVVATATRGEIGTDDPEGCPRTSSHGSARVNSPTASASSASASTGGCAPRSR
jgi:LmbE family N-acetylglucosaminyl deacetylase